MKEQVGTMVPQGRGILPAGSLQTAAAASDLAWVSSLPAAPAHIRPAVSVVTWAKSLT